MVIEFQKVGKVLPTDVKGRRPVLLREISFGVGAGVCHGFVGANGAGKSSSIRIAVGAMRPTTGTARLRGLDPHDLAARRGLGYAPDVVALDTSLTARETIALHWRLLGHRGAPPENALDVVELADRSREPISAFSKGMAQRLSLGLALLGDPDILILDEPMSGLDPVGRDLVRRIIRERHAGGATVFFSSHVLSDIEDLCTEVTVIEKGTTRYSGRVDALLGGTVGHRVTFDTRDVADPGALGLEPKDGRGVRVVDTDDALVDLLQRARAAGARIVGIETERPTLEQAVVALVARSTP